MKLDPMVVRRQPCPQCDAAVGELCRGSRGERNANHSARIAAAEEAARPQREHRYYDDERPIANTGPAVHPTIGRKIAYDACVSELMKRKGMSRADAEKRARELLGMWLPEERREIA